MDWQPEKDPDYVACFDSRDEDENLTLASTEDEGANQDGEEFNVIRILAERKVKGVKQYLVYWENFSIKWATWEPKQSFGEGSDIIPAWERRKAREDGGLFPSFDVEGWEEAKLRRKRARKIKRKQARHPTSSEEDYGSGEEEEDEDLTVSPRQRHVNTSSIAPIKVSGSGNSRSQVRGRIPSKKAEVPPLSRASNSDSDTPLMQRRRRSSSSDKPLMSKKKLQPKSSLSRIEDESRDVIQQKQKPKQPIYTAPLPKPSKPLVAPSIVRGTTSNRGGSATRGGSSVARRNVFLPAEHKKRRRLIVENASDTSKKQKLFANAHLQYKTAIQGRSLADAAPDLSAIGGVFNPSNPPSRQAALRRAQKNIEQEGSNRSAISPQSPQKASEPSDDVWSVDTPQTSIPAGQPQSSGSAVVASQVPNMSTFHAAPAPFTTPNLSQFSGPYAQEPNPTAQDPVNLPSIDQRHTASTQRQWSGDERNALICYFWNLYGRCDREATCQYVHEDADLPVAPNPSLPSARRACRYWASGNCQYGDRCTFLHEESLPQQPLPQPSTSNFSNWRDEYVRPESVTDETSSSKPVEADPPPLYKECDVCCWGGKACI